VDAQGPLADGGAVITTAGRLPCRHVIHTVGPRWAGGTRGEPETLARCYRSSLALAREHRLRSVAFPSIATGAYGYPVREAARVALTAVKGEVARSALPERVRFVLFSADDLAVYAEALAEITG
jgi:O-acetyl-ADP-ribose deacetylase (regulator of RNase III)